MLPFNKYNYYLPKSETKVGSLFFLFSPVMGSQSGKFFWFFSFFCFQICLFLSTLYVTTVKTILIFHLDYCIMPPVFPSSLPSGHQGNLSKPQIWLYHSQVQTFHWLPITLKISLHLKPFLYWILAQYLKIKDFFPTALLHSFHASSPFLNILFIFAFSNTSKLSA